MMEWRPFDIKTFLKKSRYWGDKKKQLEEELDNLICLPSLKTDAGGAGKKSGKVSNPTASTAEKRLEIKEKIREIERCEEMLNTALTRLSKDEKTLINGFFYSNKYIGVFVQEYGRQHGLCKDYVYAERDKVLEKMRRIIEHEYY